VSDRVTVREHKRNQWYPSLNAHKEITIGEHASSRATRIWQLVNPDGVVIAESRDEGQIRGSLAVQGKGWSISFRWAKKSAEPKIPNVVAASPLPPKAQGRCTKTIACGGPETDQGDVCPSCGCAFGVKQFRASQTEGTE
jgi:hypothetical protein